MTLQRASVILVAMFVASVLPVVDMTPAFAAPPTEVGRLAVPEWSAAAARASSGSGPAWRTSAVLPGGDVVMIGADWGGDEDTQVQVRTRIGATWSAWTEVPEAHDHAPDPDSDEASSTASDPIWTGPVDALQFRTTASTPQDVRFDAVRIEGGQSALEATPARGRPAASAEAMTSKPDIITRSEWGANESWKNGAPNYAANVRFAIVHHTAGSNSYSASTSDDIVRSIYSYHTQTRGWDDIGYNVLVDRYGQVFEGRSGGLERAVIGAHASGFNSGSTGIAVIGNFQDSAPTSASVGALTDLLAWKLDVHHVDPKGSTSEVAGSGSRFSEGQRVTLPAIIGHRDTGYTACPGNLLYGIVDNGTVRNSVAATGTPKLYTSEPTSVTVARGEGSNFSVKPSQTVDWTMRVRNSDGKVVHTRTGRTGSSFTANWDHTGTDGNLVPSGVYGVQISATASGRQARPIDMTVYVANEGPKGDPNADPVPPPPGAIHITGDWDGDGVDTPGWFKDGNWGLHDRSHAEGNTWRLSYGRAGDKPVVGDWNGDGRDTIGVVRGNEWILRYEYRSGADIVLKYGRSTDKPVTGDWNADGRDTIGVVRGNEWILRYEYRSGADIVLRYGDATDKPVTGDWNGDGRDTIGVVRGNEFILRYEYRSGADIVLRYGDATDTPVTGDWNGDGTDTLGVVRGSKWILRYIYRSGADYVFLY